MSAATPMRRGSRPAGALICAMMTLSVAYGLGAGIPAWLPGVFAWTAGLLLIANVSRYQRVQVALMGSVGFAGLAIAAAAGDWSWWSALLEGNQSILSMLAMVTFLRLVARTGGHAGETLPRGKGAVRQTVLATHLFSVVINISAAYIVGQRISANGTLTPLQAKVISRAFVAAACWSPFFASVAVVLIYVPGVDVFAVASVNFVLAVMLVGYSYVVLAHDADADTFVGYPVHVEALTLPVVLASLVFALYTLTSGIPVLTIIVLAAASSVALLSTVRPPRETARRITRHVREELPGMGSEFALFLGAAVLAAGIAAAARRYGIDIVVDPHTAFDAIPMMLALVILSLVGVHPVISLATMSTVFPAVLHDPDLVAMIVLMAWSVALSASPLSGATLALQGRFGIPSTHFLRWNLGYVLFGIAAASGVLAGYDYFGA